MKELEKKRAECALDGAFLRWFLCSGYSGMCGRQGGMVGDRFVDEFFVAK